LYQKVRGIEGKPENKNERNWSEKKPIEKKIHRAFLQLAPRFTCFAVCSHADFWSSKVPSKDVTHSLCLNHATIGSYSFATVSTSSLRKILVEGKCVQSTIPWKELTAK
jgi:hypothetical protein